MHQFRNKNGGPRCHVCGLLEVARNHTPKIVAPVPYQWTPSAQWIAWLETLRKQAAQSQKVHVIMGDHGPLEDRAYRHQGRAEERFGEVRGGRDWATIETLWVDETLPRSAEPPTVVPSSYRTQAIMRFCGCGGRLHKECMETGK